MAVLAEWIGSKEAAELMDVSRVTIWRMVREGRLKPIAIFKRRAIFNKNDILIEAAKRKLLAESQAA